MVRPSDIPLVRYKIPSHSSRDDFRAKLHDDFSVTKLLVAYFLLL